MQYAVGPAWIQNNGFQAATFAEMAKIGLHELRKLGIGAEIVCGPISTGGTGNTLENFRVFNAVIRELKDLGRNIFDQMPFESGLGRLRQTWESEPGNAGYCMPILTEFYAKLFETGLIRSAWFIPDWESSFGARWEHEEFRRSNVAINYLTTEWLQQLLERIRGTP